MSKNVSRGTAAALCALTAVTAVAVSYIGMERRLEALLPGYKTDAAIYGKIGEIRRTVDAYYVGQYDQQEAVDDAAAGFVVGVGDRWSSYMSAEEYQAYKLSFSGQSFGIGLYTAYDADQNELRIVEVFPWGRTAKRSACRRATSSWARKERPWKKTGTAIPLPRWRARREPRPASPSSAPRPARWRTVEMERKTTDTIMAAGHMLKDGQTGFVRIYNFRRGSEKQVREQVKKLTAEGAKRLIFDVRNNPGGSVDSVCDALDALLPEGKIMTLRTKAGKETVYESDKNEVDLPMAVLVNADSISAAEFFAAALQEYGKAVVVGEQTIGKGYSQQNYELSDGSALHLSDQEYFTPNGKSLIGTGVTPDVQSSPAEGFNLYFTPQEDDVQLQAALAALGA